MERVMMCGCPDFCYRHKRIPEDPLPTPCPHKWTKVLNSETKKSIMMQCHICKDLGWIIK